MTLRIELALICTKDTVGAAVRQKGIKSETTWKLRHLKWILTGCYFMSFINVIGASQSNTLLRQKEKCKCLIA